MKFPVDVPPIRKALGIALVAAVAYVIVEGTGIGAPARQFVGAAMLQVKVCFRVSSKRARSFPVYPGRVKRSVMNSYRP